MSVPHLWHCWYTIKNVTMIPQMEERCVSALDGAAFSGTRHISHSKAWAHLLSRLWLAVHCWTDGFTACTHFGPFPCSEEQNCVLHLVTSIFEVNNYFWGTRALQPSTDICVKCGVHGIKSTVSLWVTDDILSSSWVFVVVFFDFIYFHSNFFNSM